MKTNQLVEVRNGSSVTTSLQIAKVFGKNHFDVLRNIRELECSPKFIARNFAVYHYHSKLNENVTRKLPMYYITRDGFTFLAMGFTGKIAAQFKEDYINAFNEMEATIKGAAFDEAALLQEMKEYFDKRSIDIRRKIADLRQKTKVNPGLCDIPEEINIRPELGLRTNIKALMAMTSGAVFEGWWALYNYLKVKQENDGLRDDFKKAISDLAWKYRIFPEMR